MPTPYVLYYKFNLLHTVPPQSKNLSYTSEYRQHQNLSGIALYYDVTYVHNIFYFREKNVRYKFGKKVAVCFQKFPVKFLETLL